MVHDFEHLGVNNDYLVRMHDQLATLYNDKSPLENHHLAAAFELLQTPGFNCLAKLAPALRVRGGEGRNTTCLCCIVCCKMMCTCITLLYAAAVVIT